MGNVKLWVEPVVKLVFEGENRTGQRDDEEECGNQQACPAV
ncbi:MAG TPA: hypothetical protein VMS18_15150 [Candidatus Binatia bacterium]|nr:hypothetical protein [Candidatus Binatia bacterium]